VEEPDEYEYPKRVQTRSPRDWDKGSSKINLSHSPSEFVSRLAERSPFPGLGATSEVRLEAQVLRSVDRGRENLMIGYFAKVPVRQASWRRCFSAFHDDNGTHVPALLERRWSA
jgi:hypothetical protein